MGWFITLVSFPSTDPGAATTENASCLWNEVIIIFFCCSYERALCIFKGLLAGNACSWRLPLRRLFRIGVVKGAGPSLLSMPTIYSPTLNALLRSSFDSIVFDRVAAGSDNNEDAISSSFLRSDSTYKCSDKSSHPLIPLLSRADSTILLVTLMLFVGECDALGSLSVCF